MDLVETLEELAFQGPGEDVPPRPGCPRGKSSAWAYDASGLPAPLAVSWTGRPPRTPPARAPIEADVNVLAITSKSALIELGDGRGRTRQFWIGRAYIKPVDGAEPKVGWHGRARLNFRAAKRAGLLTS